MRIAHLSDLHFAHISFDFKQFLSKRWLGNLNLLLFRRYSYQTDHLFDLPKVFKSAQVDWICMTGDVATTSLREEFMAAANLINQMPAPVLFLPGNHDAYTKDAEKEKRFYHYFPDESLKKERVVLKPLGEKWWWIGLDCAMATSVLFSNGKFFRETEEILKKRLAEIPKDGKIVLGNHFPFYRSGNPRHDLSRCRKLQALVRKDPRIKLYLHGHDHKPYIIDKTKEKLPLVLNSGSCAHVPGGIFYLIDLESNCCWVQQGKLENQQSRFLWTFSEKTCYLFR